MARPLFTGALLLSMVAAVAGCGSAKVAAERQVGAPTGAPAVVYVADFELDAGNVRSERGMLPPLSPPPGLGNVLPRLPGTARDSADRARELVELMSKSLVKELGDKGVTVRRLGKGDDLPYNGWLVRGVFTSVQEGNQLRRAVIGFGTGTTELQVVVSVDDLTAGVPKPLYKVDTSADSGKLPGAVITLNPYIAAARFVLADGDLDRNVKQTAARIAEQTTRRLREAETGPTRTRLESRAG